MSTTAELLKGAAELFPDEVVTRAHVRHLDLPFGAAGRLGFRLLRPAIRLGLRLSLRRFAAWAPGYVGGAR